MDLCCSFFHTLQLPLSILNFLTSPSFFNPFVCFLCRNFSKMNKKRKQVRSDLHNKKTMKCCNEPSKLTQTAEGWWLFTRLFICTGWEQRLEMCCPLVAQKKNKFQVTTVQSFLSFAFHFLLKVSFFHFFICTLNQNYDQDAQIYKCYIKTFFHKLSFHFSFH